MTVRRPHSSSERGNVFFTLFGAVAIVGVLGAGIMATMRGPLSTMVEVERRTKAESQMSIASKLAMLDAVQGADSGDCDADGFTEPPEYAAALPGLTGGGTLPSTVGSNRQDPWGMDYGYCGWDAGGVDTLCAGTKPTLLPGNASPTDENYTVIAIISAGPDRTFQTTCEPHASGGLTKLGDDIVTQFDYESAAAATGGLWKLKSGDPDIAQLDREAEFSSRASFLDGIDLTGSTAALELGAASMLFPTCRLVTPLMTGCSASTL
jgi:hypothetical protein